jgi:hypothetical protein
MAVLGRGGEVEPYQVSGGRGRGPGGCWLKTALAGYRDAERRSHEAARGRREREQREEEQQADHGALQFVMGDMGNRMGLSARK